MSRVGRPVPYQSNCVLVVFVMSVVRHKKDSHIERKGF